jgi:small conductance mechanosensitive channel
VVVGLAGQTVFGNLLAGLVLVLFQPFSIGDRVSLMTSQYPVLMPSFPHEALMPAYVGTVTDVNLLYSYLELESGLPMAIPNGIVLQAAVLNHASAVHRVVRLRFDVDLALDPSQTSERVRTALEDMPGLAPGRSPDVQVADLSPTTFSLLLRLPVSPIVSDDAVRDHALTRAAAAVRAATRQETTAAAGVH